MVLRGRIIFILWSLEVRIILILWSLGVGVISFIMWSLWGEDHPQSVVLRDESHLLQSVVFMAEGKAILHCPSGLAPVLQLFPCIIYLLSRSPLSIVFQNAQSSNAI